jgi:hypothetical protein
MMQVQYERPIAMQVLIDTKPRYRAQLERGRTYKSRKDAAHRYESWEAGPTIPNSCLVDLYDPHPFKGMWENPGEIAIMQGGDFDDWRRMLQLLKGFVSAPIKGRERRIIVDECLDFTSAILSGLTPEMMYSIVRLERERNAESVSIWVPIEYTVSHHLFYKWPPASIFSIYVQTEICGISAKSEFATPQVPMEIGCSGNTEFSRAELCRILSREG